MRRLRIFATIAARNLVQSGRRTLLLSIAISAVTFLLVLMLSLTQGISENVMRSATTLLSGHVNIGGFYKPTPSEADPLVLKADRLEEEVRAHTPGLTHLVDRTQGFGRIVSPTESIRSLLMGIDIDDETSFKEVVQLASERAYEEGGDPDVVEGDLNRLTEPRTALLFASQARRLGVEIGDPLTIRAQTFGGAANTIDVTVVAIARDVGLLSNFAAFVPKSDLRELYRLEPGTTGLIMAYLDDPERAEESMARLRTALEAEGYELLEHRAAPLPAKVETVRGQDWTGFKIDLTTWKDQISFLEWLLTGINTVSFVITLILSLIIGVGMINTMLMSIRERTSEIGTMRAIGMKRTEVLVLFMLEAMVLGFVASATGGLLGWGTVEAIDAAEIHIPVEAVQAILMSDVLHLAVGPTRLAVAVGSMTLFIGLAALWPAVRAARMQPVDAIHEAE